MSEVSGLWSYTKYTPTFYFIVWADTRVVSEAVMKEIDLCFSNLDYSLDVIDIKDETFNLPLEFLQ